MALWTPYTEEALDLSKHYKNDQVPSKPKSLYVYQYQASLLAREYQTNHVNTSLLSPESVRSAWSPVSKSTISPPPEFYEEYLSDDVEYQEFERNALRALVEQNGSTLLGNNPRMRRAVQRSQAVDDSYKKQRERNNFAAKQSRDRRKMREVRLAFRVTFLQKKLTALRAKLGAGHCIRCQKCKC